MPREKKGGVALRSRVKPDVLRDLKIAAAERHASIGEVVEDLLRRDRDHRMAAGQLEAQLRQDVADARLGEKAALDVARRAVARADAMQGRLAKVSAVTKSRARGEPGWR